MDIKQQWADIQKQMQQWMDDAKEYFSHLNQQEQYGWMGEGAGFVLFIAGIILLIL